MNILGLVDKLREQTLNVAPAQSQRLMPSKGIPGARTASPQLNPISSTQGTSPTIQGSRFNQQQPQAGVTPNQLPAFRPITAPEERVPAGLYLDPNTARQQLGLDKQWKAGDLNFNSVYKPIPGYKKQHSGFLGSIRNLIEDF